MLVLKELFTSDVGLFSIATIGMVLGMGVYYVRYFLRHMHEDEAQLKRGQRS
jgi:uncharacterized membrane-anchored protein